MKRYGRFPGPRLGTKILMLGLLLLMVPWFSYRQLLEMERLLLQGQSNAQLLTAEGISTLFNGRDDILSQLPVAAEDAQNLYVHSLSDPIRLDGNGSDWGEASLQSPLVFGAAAGAGDGEFSLVLGERAGQLYVLLDITDAERIYRSSDRLRLDSSDHARISYLSPAGDNARLAIVFEGPGTLSAYAADEDWRYASTGAPDARLQGVLVQTPAGHRMEFRLPLDLMGSSRSFGLAYVDVDDPVSRRVRQITQTLPTAGKESFNLVVMRSPEVVSIIQGLGYAGARILVIDPTMRVRAETGSYMSGDRSEVAAGWASGLPAWLMRLRAGFGNGQDLRSPETATSVATSVIASSLQGEPIALRRTLADGQEVIMAAHPIISGDRIIGTVVVEQNTRDVLAFQREALDQVMWVSFLSFAGVLLALLAFSARLAWRIRNLRRDASSAIDHHGRLRTTALRHELRAGDELGDLARSVSNMLSRLKQHNHFLENMPRTLRHEINNPLNVLSTSLQNLALENPELEDNKYLESARRGVLRIGAIVQNLADAANLEDALRSEELERIDLCSLVENYVANCARTHPKTGFLFSGPDTPVFALVSDFRIEQMLDKIVDNAIDFHRAGTPITVHLSSHGDFLQLSVANRGPTLSDEAGRTLFDSMVSHRAPENRLHFGLGLYVVRIIAEHHGGFVRAVNLADQSGVAILVQLPLYRAEVASTRSPLASADPGERSLSA
ncbi:MAG: ATP-binding protein [Pseudomonadales bacterium]